MTDTIKRLVSLALVFVLVIGMLPTAYASETEDDTETLTTSVDIPEASSPETTFPEETGETVVTQATETTPAAQPEESTASTVPIGTEEETEPTSPGEEAAASEPTDVTLPSESSGASEPSTEATEPPTAATEVSTPSEPSHPADEAAPPESTHAAEETAPSDATDGAEETGPSDGTQPTEETEPFGETAPAEEAGPSDPPETVPSIAETEPEVPTETTEPAQAAEETSPTVPVSDPAADVESPAVWEATFANITLTGDPATDLLAIAASQLGYTESTRNFLIEGEGEDAVMYGYTRYGAWYGLPYGDWCAMFISFCLNYAGLTDIPAGAGCQTWIDTLTEAGLYYDASEFNPAPGDVIFYDLNGDGRSDHVGIVSEITEDGYVTIEGNYSDMVAYVDRTDAGEVMGFLRIAGTPEITSEFKTVYGEWFKIEEPDPYGVATMDFDWDTVQGNWYEREYIYWDGSEKLSFTYNGVSVSEDHMTIHGMIVNGTNYRAYCIDPGIRVGAGDYTGTTSAWSALSTNQQKAIGLALLYGYPTTLDSSDYMTGIAYQLATQVIIQEIRLGWRSDTSPFACTNNTFINFLMKRTGLATADGEAVSQTTLKTAYDAISNNLASHYTFPCFSADGKDVMTQDITTTVTIKLTRQSDGSYKWTGTDYKGVLSKINFGSVSGLTFTKNGNTLTVSSSTAFTGTKTVTATKTGAPLVSSADFAIFKFNSGSNYQDILITDGKYDPIPALLNIEVDSTSPLQVKKTAVRGSDVEGYDLKLWNATTGEVYTLKTDANGVGHEATVNADGSFTITGGSTIEGFTPGTYDILEVLANKGAGTVYPSYITIDIQDSNGRSVAGDSWPQTFYAPGGTELSDPVVVTQNSGAAGTITIDSGTGNARLNHITFSESDLGVGKTIVLTINNDEYHGHCYLKKNAANGAVGGACFKVYRWSSGDTWYVKTNSSGVGYEADGKYNITATKGFDGMTNGTYDLVEDLVAMGLAGKMFPTSWTISVYNSAGALINTTTYTEADGSITKEANGNARLRQITVSGISKGGYVSMSINNEPTSAPFRVKKTTSTGTHLSGWIFSVYSDSSCSTLVTTLTTTSTGYTGAVDLEVGKTYYVKETGHTSSSTWNSEYLVKDTSKKSVTIVADTTNTLTFSNTFLGKLSVKKATNTKKDLDGWEFGVYTNAQCTSSSLVTTIVTNTSGIATSENLTPGTYYVKETGGKHYDAYWEMCTEVKTIVVSANQTTDPSRYVYDNTEYGRFKVQKVTNTGAYLQNWEFTAYTDQACTKVAADKNGDPVVLYSDAKGSATSGYVLPGTYYVKETGGGYFDNEYWENSQEVQSVVVAAGKDTPLNYAIENTTYGRAKITKTLVTDGPMDGWVFKITDADGREIEGSPFTTDANGTFTTGNILPGVYTVEEILPEDSVYYCTTANPQTITVEEMRIAEATFTNALLPAELHVEKVDGYGNPMQGVKFLLEYYDDADSTWKAVTYSDSKYVVKGKSNTSALNGSTDCVLSTDANGKISYTNLYPTIRYRLTEISTLTNNTLLKDYAFEGELPYTVDGTRSFTITVHVVNSETFTLPATGATDLLLIGLGPVLTALSIAMAMILFVPNGSNIENPRRKNCFMKGNQK